MSTNDQDYAFEQAERLCLLAVDDPNLIPEYKHWNAIAQGYEHQGWKKRNGMTQHDQIIKHLNKAGSITVREALVEYSIASLTKRIAELRELGHDIISKPKTHPVTGQRYVRYSFAA